MNLNGEGLTSAKVPATLRESEYETKDCARGKQPYLGIRFDKVYMQLFLN